MTTQFFRIFWPESATRIQGLVRFRWMAIIGMIFGVVPLLQVGYLQKSQMPFFMCVIALLALFNGLTEGIWSKNTSLVKEDRLLFAQLTVDLLTVTALLFVCGSANNPLIFILSVHAFLGGMLLRNTLSGVFIFVVLALLTILQIETYQDSSITLNVDNREMYFNFMAQWSVVIISWFVAHLFSGLLQKQEERIRELQERQSKADRLKALGALTAGFSHQLATPLNALQLRLNRAQRKSIPNEIHGELVEAQSSLQECVSVFRHMAEVFSNSTAAEPQNTKIQTLVSDVLRAWKQDHPQVNIETHFSEEDLFCQVQVLAFAQSLFDMLDNAFEASAQNDVQISLRLYQQDSQVVLEVIDSGKGLSQEILSRLGEPFATDKVGGNGLGVYSAQMMAQSLGGEFRLYNNQSGRGATAKLLIPAGSSL